MAFQKSVAARNAELDAFEAAVGVSPVLQFWSGAQPANCAAADSGVLLAELELPSDWMSDAAGGTKAKLGLWQTLTAIAAGTIGHFRLKDSGDECHAQGSVTESGLGGHITLDETTIVVGQDVTVTAFALTEGNA